MKTGVLTLSDKGALGQREDRSGPLIQKMLISIGAEIAMSQILPDQEDLIQNTLNEFSTKPGISSSDNSSDFLQHEHQPHKRSVKIDLVLMKTYQIFHCFFSLFVRMLRIGAFGGKIERLLSIPNYTFRPKAR